MLRPNEYMHRMNEMRIAPQKPRFRNLFLSLQRRWTWKVILLDTAIFGFFSPFGNRN